MTTAINSRRLRWAQIGAWNDASGGPNLRDAPSELAPNEAEDSFNITYDERGGATSRLGYSKRNGTPFGGGLVHNEYWSPLLGAWITQAGTSLYLADTNTIRKTFTTAATVTFAELGTHVIAAHPVDGLWTSTDGVTWTVMADPDAPTTGTCLAVWQNKLWVGLPNGSVHWSAAGDPLTWSATDFNDIWEKDTQPVVALHIGSGQDILGQAGLLVFKQESLYRINDSSTGAYTTVDATIGAAGPLAVGGVGAKVIWICKHGVYWWADGVVGAQNGTADRFLPLWNSTQLNLSQQALWCAGREGTRMRFSVTTAGQTANDLSFVYHPEQGWLAPGSDAMSCYATATGTSDAISGGSPTVAGQVYTLSSGGSDDGAAISWRFQTRWFPVAGGFYGHVWRLIALMRGTGTLTILKDFETTGTDRAFDTTSSALTYDSGLKYDSGLVYDGGTSFQTPVPFFSVGRCRYLSFKFTGSTSTVANAQPLLNGTVSADIGQFGLFGLLYLYYWGGMSA